MQEDLNGIVERALAAFGAAADPASLENAKARVLGKSGELTALLRALGALAPEARKGAGARINAAKARIEQALEARRGELSGARLQARLAEDAAEGRAGGRLHRARPGARSERPDGDAPLRRPAAI